MIVCLDASVVVNWLLPEAADLNDDPLDAILGEAEQVVAPPLLFAESTSALSRLVYLDRLAAGDATAALQDLFRITISLVHEPAVYIRALELARRLGHKKAYDTQYIAVAEATRATLLTSDGGMHTNATRLGIKATLLQ